jgi:hypothetical protein
MDVHVTRVDREHPLTGKYIQLVAEGKTPFEATLALIGPLLSREEAPRQCTYWESDVDIQHRVAQTKLVKHEMFQQIREKVIARSVAMAIHDPRKYYTPAGLKPISDWTLEEAQAVKKVKITETTDPFGTVKRVFDLEFYDAVKAIKALCDLFPEIVTQTIDLSSSKSYDQMSDAELERVHQQLLS